VSGLKKTLERVLVATRRLNVVPALPSLALFLQREQPGKDEPKKEEHIGD
jgi:hypothetical protein